MRAICVNTSKPRMLHFLCIIWRVSYLTIARQGLVEFQSFWKGTLAWLCGQPWRGPGGQHRQNRGHWICCNEWKWIMWICSLDKKTRRTFTCWDLWVWTHLKTTRSIYIILYLYLWYFDFRYFACCESATMHEHRAQGCQARGFALPVLSGSPSNALSKCCKKECFLIDSNPASFAGTAQRAVFGGSLVLLVGSWHLVPPCSGRALLTGPLCWKALTCPLTLWKPLCVKTCCLTSFWSMCAVQDLTHLPDHRGVLVERVGHIWALSENQLRSCCIGSHPSKHTTTDRKRL